MKKHLLWGPLLVLVLLLLVAEGAMQVVFSIQGYTVGNFAPNWFPSVSGVSAPKLTPSFATDSTGTFRANAAFWAARGVAINSLGFLGAEWAVDTTKPRVLLLGDSFAWGAGADSLALSFAHLVQRDTGIELYNTGIPGADPAQYQLIAERFLPVLKPDVAIVCLYLGNDLATHTRKPLAYKALYYPTDGGWFPGYYRGRYFDSLPQSYLYYQQQYRPQGWFARAACHTALGTALYALPVRIQENQEREHLKKSTVTNQHLKAIKNLCDKNFTKLIIVAIPYSATDLGVAYEADPHTYILQHYAPVLSGLESLLVAPTFFHEHFHPLPDGHFNNSGHAQMAKAIVYALQNTVKK